LCLFEKKVFIDEAETIISPTIVTILVVFILIVAMIERTGAVSTWDILLHSVFLRFTFSISLIVLLLLLAMTEDHLTHHPKTFLHQSQKLFVFFSCVALLRQTFFIVFIISIINNWLFLHLVRGNVIVELQCLLVTFHS